jgi:hypothetical protein
MTVAFSLLQTFTFILEFNRSTSVLLAAFFEAGHSDDSLKRGGTLCETHSRGAASGISSN